MMKIAVDVRRFREIREKMPLNCENASSILEKLDFAAQSIGKHADYCQYHYDQFQLAIDRELPSGLARLNCNQDARIAYEAHSLAFLQNLHALVDSLPFILNIMFIELGKADVDNGGVGWNDDFLRKFNGLKVHESLNVFARLECFKSLKRFVNCAKHRHLLPIEYSNNQLFFLFPGSTENQNLNEFMVLLHDKLVPQVFGLYQEILSEADKNGSHGDSAKSN